VALYSIINFGGNIMDKILKKVEKPIRYTGGELNMCVKDPKNVKLRMAFCFPDIYEIGMSHLGLRIIYDIYNRRDDIYCERVFAPWVDMEKLMRENDIKLFALETKDEIRKFDMIGFTLQYEMSYTNILNMLDLAGIPLKAEDRGEGTPFVIAGGPCAYNPEPLADFFDFFILGEGEEVNLEVADAYIKWKEAKKTRKEYLEMVAQIEGVYVPSFYDVSYDSKGRVEKFERNNENAKDIITKRIIENLDEVAYPEKWIVPYLNPVHDRIMLEMFRGCIRGCRFCQAGYIYRPVREKSPQVLEKLADTLVKNTGYEEISLTSLSTSDYNNFHNLADNLISKLKPQKVNLSLPSLRIDSISLKLLDEVNQVRKSGLTFAPEAGTQRLRDVINKGITEDDIIGACRLAFKSGWNTIKLYFMIGLPTETMDDLQGIVDLANKIVDAYYEIPKEERTKGLTVTVSASTFVPKPFTPFQWFGQDSLETIKEKQKFLMDNLKNRAVKYNWHDAKTSVIEAVIAKGDRKLGKALLRAYELGCKFDSWGEFFKYDLWMQAFNETGINPEFYANRKIDLDEELPWDFINILVNKDFFKREYNNALEEKVTPNCRQKCAGCGINECKLW
jgi:radical SAM family uncharacterized protein